MATLAAATAPASLGKSEMLGAPLSFSGRAHSAQPASAAGPAKIVALFSKKKAAAKPKPSAASPASEELAKWYGEKAARHLYGLSLELYSCRIELCSQSAVVHTLF